MILIVKLNIFRGDLSDISAKSGTLHSSSASVLKIKFNIFLDTLIQKNIFLDNKIK